jgi:hypothetical protein
MSGFIPVTKIKVGDELTMGKVVKIERSSTGKTISITTESPRTGRQSTERLSIQNAAGNGITRVVVL